MCWKIIFYRSEVSTKPRRIIFEYLGVTCPHQTIIVDRPKVAPMPWRIIFYRSEVTAEP